MEQEQTKYNNILYKTDPVSCNLICIILGKLDRTGLISINYGQVIVPAVFCPTNAHVSKRMIFRLMGRKMERGFLFLKFPK